MSKRDRSRRNSAADFSRNLTSSVGIAGVVLACVLVASAICSPALAQRDFSSVTMQSQKVSGNVHMLVGAGGNIGVSAGSDGILIVDDQFAPLAGKIREALAEIGTGELEFVLNTHFHGDHTGSNAEFGEEALIVAHANVRKRLSTPQTSPRGTTPAQPESAWPVVTFEDSLSIHFNGEEIRVWHLPAGHTDGDVVVHFVDSNVLHMGDHFFVDRFPFVDLSSGGNALGFAENVGSVLESLPAGAQIIPGHGPLAKAEDLERFPRDARSDDRKSATGQGQRPLAGADQRSGIWRRVGRLGGWFHQRFHLGRDHLQQLVVLQKSLSWKKQIPRPTIGSKAARVPELQRPASR